MSHEMTDQPAARGEFCPLYSSGCRNLISQNRWEEHCYTIEHIESMINYLIQLQEKSEYSALLPVGPSETNGSPTEAATSVDVSKRLFSQLNDLIIRHMQLSNTVNSPANPSTSIDQIYARSTSPVQLLITQQDQTTDPATSLLLNQAETRIHNYQTPFVASQAMATSTMGLETNATEQHDVQQQLDADAQEMMTSILEIESEFKPVSDNGCLVWNIKKPFHSNVNGLRIESPQFELPKNGPRFWARLILQDLTNSGYMSIHVHLTFPFRYAFQATIKIVLVDQSENPPWKHHIKSCSGNLANVNDHVDMDHFIELTNIVNSRFIRDDSIHLIIKVEERTVEEFINHPASIQDALLQMAAHV